MGEEHEGIVVAHGLPPELLAMLVNSRPGFKVSLLVGELMAIANAVGELDKSPEEVVRNYAEAVASPEERDIFIEMMVASYYATEGMLDELLEEAREAGRQREEAMKKAQIADDWHVHGSEDLADRGSPFG